MKKIVTACILSLCFLGLELLAEGFYMTSEDINGQLSNRQVFDGFGCNGENISPSLSWDKAPEGTESFAITMFDPDAPSGSGWWHWLIFDLDKKNTIIIGSLLAANLGSYIGDTITITTSDIRSTLIGSYPRSINLKIIGIFELRTEIDQYLTLISHSTCLLYTSPSPRDKRQSRMPSSA